MGKFEMCMRVGYFHFKTGEYINQPAFLGKIATQDLIDLPFRHHDI